MVPRASLLLQIISLSLFGGEYYFTYRLEINDIIPSYEKLLISRKMTAIDTKPIKYFQIENDKGAATEKEFVEAYKDEILEIILAQKTIVQTNSKTESLTFRESSILRSSPTLISVDFKEDFGTIGVFE